MGRTHSKDIYVLATDRSSRRVTELQIDIRTSHFQSFLCENEGFRILRQVRKSMTLGAGLPAAIANSANSCHSIEKDALLTMMEYF